MDIDEDVDDVGPTTVMADESEQIGKKKQM